MSALQTLIDAVALGSIYALVAMGIGLVFGVMRLINFAHGELITAGRLRSRPHEPLAARGEPRRLLRRRGRARARDGRDLPAAADDDADHDAGDDVRRLVPPPGRGAPRVRRAGENVGVLPELNRAVSIGDLRIRWVTLVSIAVGGVLLGATAAVLLRGRISGSRCARRR